ncbi:MULTISPECIES: type II toxin-antitoxin system Phd/YefM family antitoxin [Spirosoma]|uniref:Antitoxin n=1 Tax=Spirosoma sordidisoli TaxID=2502893 RepID=A0A4Q2UNK6_9BACT|nr:type II toxin-antitoxin system Phd/YefM family antitoxin [Spirosoma sp. 209]RYC71243.1 type II toxin-antitoxin system Phd/YefM family antitoxin [Spirosoma sordidisoli]
MSRSVSSTQDARKNFSEIISKAAFAKEATIITRSGKNVAAVISFDDYEFYQQLEDKLDGELATARLAKEGRRYSTEEVKARLGL